MPPPVPPPAVLTVGAACQGLARRLAMAGVEGARGDARLLVAAAIGAGMEAVVGYPERPLGDAERARLDGLAGRRAGREPMARILGQREFWSLPFRLAADTLVPRPDSETVVEAALAWAAEAGLKAPRVLDLGTGSGCLLLAVLAHLPGAQGVGVDRAEGAVRAARDNSRRLGLDGRARFLVGDWATALGVRFAMVLANPPYVADAEIDGLAPEVAAFEPRAALAGGADGLAAYRALAPALGGLLREGGAAFLEIGAGQGAAVRDLLAGHGLTVAATRRDLAGVARCLTVMDAVAGFAKKRVGISGHSDYLSP